jgi:hypothetical protein
MKKIIAILSCALALGAGLSAVRGTDPALAKAGRVLILDNEKTWTGDVERVGDQYRVKRLVGETWIQASRVLQVCATLEDAHRFMQSRANLDDPDERIRLAEWCRQHNLLTQASEEAKAAFALKPDDPKVKHLMNYLAQAKAQADQPRPAPQPERATPRVDLTAEALGQFAAKVQPILMNACVNCHNSGRPNGFQLVRTSGGLNNRRSLEQNLAAVMAEINLNNPGSSRLLQKAVSIHAPGMTQGPLKNRQVPAYQTIDQWVRMMLDTNPHLREQTVASVNPPPAPVPIAPQQPAGTGAFGEDRGTPAKPNETRPAEAAPAAPKPSDDPADPSTFNREFHPERKQP